MKLLFDENLSSHLVDLLADCYPGSCHVRGEGLERADDSTVWNHAAAQGLMIVSKDSDFHQRSLLFGPPPKVVWIQIGTARRPRSSKRARVGGEDFFDRSEAIEQSAREGRPNTRQPLQQEEPPRREAFWFSVESPQS